MKKLLTSLCTLDSGVTMAVLVAALGYFVDIYDLVLFSAVRVASLQDLGVTGDALLSDGVFLLNCQMVGMLVGGIVWGIWGDKRGRLQVLFGSILLYSVANLLNGFVENVGQYAVLRVLAGIGLAGEIGAGITLVSELLPKETRGIGTTLVASVGVTGALAAVMVSQVFTWRTAYIVGGVMGLMLLFLRVSVTESGMFDAVKAQDTVPRGDLKLLFRTKERLARYLHCISVGVPVWFVIGILVTFSPEIGIALGISDPVQAPTAVFYCYLGLTIGDIVSGFFSQIWRSRRRVLIFLLIGTTLVTFLICHVSTTPKIFYGLTFAAGLCIGYWAVFVTMAAEQFGTNLRATVATTVPNFVRGAVVPMTLLFGFLKGSIGVINSAQVVGIITFLLAFYSLARLRETFGINLDFIEE